MTHFSFSLLTLVGLALGGSAVAQEVIRVGGTGTGTLLMQRVLTSYAKLRPNVQATAIMPPLGSNGALRALAAGSIQLGIVSIPSAYPAKSPDAAATTEVPWVRTPFVFTGRDILGGTQLTIGQVAAMYSGRVVQWPGGAPIRLVTRTDRESDTRLLRAVSSEMDEALTQASKRLGMPFAENDFDNQDLLQRIPGSFGAIALGQLLLSGSPLKPVTLDGVAPSSESLRSGTYRLEKPLYLVVSKAPSAGTLELIKYLQSPEVMKMIAAYAFVPLQR